MQHRASERGNTILISTVLILGLTVMGLGLSKFVRSYANDSADRKGAGYPALQALAAAEMGINDVMYRSNEPAVAATPPTANFSLSVPLRFDYSAYAVTPTLRYDVTYLGVTAGVYRYRSLGTATAGAGQSNMGAVTRALRFEVRHNGTNWVLQNYAYE